MANTSITLSNNDGILLPSAASIPVVRGDTVTFSTSDGGPAFLFFSPAAIALLSPAPAVPFAMSGAAEFSFNSSDAGVYSVYFETEASFAPPPFPATESSLLMLEIDLSRIHYSTTDTHTKPG